MEIRVVEYADQWFAALAAFNARLAAAGSSSSFPPPPDPRSRPPRFHDGLNRFATWLWKGGARSHPGMTRLCAGHPLGHPVLWVRAPGLACAARTH